MIGLRRAPREVYRIYGEREYLAGAGCESQPELAHAPERRRRRIASVALLLGALGAFGGVVALNTLPQLRGSGGRRLGVSPRPTAHTLIAAVTHSSVSARAGSMQIKGDRAARSYRVGLHHAHGGGASVGVSTPGNAPTLVAVTVLAADNQPAAGNPRQYPERAEFGFER